MWVDVDERGRVVLPLELREQLDIVDETKLVVEAWTDGRLTLGRVTLDAEFQSAEEFDDAFVYDLKRYLRR